MDSKMLVEILSKRMNRKQEDVEKLLDAFITAVKSRCGELDSVATDDACLIFVEVKMRFGDEYGLPSEAVDYVKQRKLAAVAAQYIKRYMLFGAPARFDVIEVRGNTKEVNHIINAFETHMRY